MNRCVQQRAREVLSFKTSRLSKEVKSLLALLVKLVSQLLPKFSFEALTVPRCLNWSRDSADPLPVIVGCQWVASDSGLPVIVG